MFSRRLHGRRGLKSHLKNLQIIPTKSPPSRAAWIEILAVPCLLGTRWSPPSRAAWIEILETGGIRLKRASRRLHGRRGLKCVVIVCFGFPTSSPPSRAAWIEMPPSPCVRSAPQSPPSRAAWIEIPLSAIISAMYRSLHHKWYGLKRFACVICLRSESSLIKTGLLHFRCSDPVFGKNCYR